MKHINNMLQKKKLFEIISLNCKYSYSIVSIIQLFSNNLLLSDNFFFYNNSKIINFEFVVIVATMQ